MVIEELSPEKYGNCHYLQINDKQPVIIINAVDVNCAKGETDVDNDEDEEEKEDIDNHVAHGDDDWPDLPVHQPRL